MPHLSRINPGLGHVGNDQSAPAITGGGLFDDEAPVGGDEKRTVSEPKLVVPANLEPIIRAVAEASGVPFYVIAGAIQATHGTWNDRIVPELIAEVAAGIAEARPSEPQALAEPRMWDNAAFETLGRGSARWMERYEEIIYPEVTVTTKVLGKTLIRKFRGEPDYQVGTEQQPLSPGKHWIPKIGSFGGYYVTVSGTEGPALADIADVYNAFWSFTGRRPSEAEAQRYVGLTDKAMRAAVLALPEAKGWREFGPRIQETRGFADELYLRYLGKAPTNAEVMEIIRRGHTPDSLERYLREQPYLGTTLGQLRAVRDLADRYARERIGREADDGEVNFLVTNNITTPDGIAAYYEQLQQRTQTGDPAFAWVADPKTWRSRRTEVQQAWQAAGLLGDAPPQMVNRSLSEKWDAEGMQDEISALPAPGFAEGTTVGQVNRVRAIASRYKQALFPGQDVTKSEIEVVIAMHPEEIRRYYRSLPAETRIPPQGPAPAGRPDIGAGALREQPYTEPERVSIAPPALPGAP